MLCTFFLLLLRSTVPTWRAIKENETINVRMCVKGRNYFMIYGDLIVFLKLTFEVDGPNRIFYSPIQFGIFPLHILYPFSYRKVILKFLNKLFLMS